MNMFNIAKKISSLTSSEQQYTQKKKDNSTSEAQEKILKVPLQKERFDHGLIVGDEGSAFPIPKTKTSMNSKKNKLKLIRKLELKPLHKLSKDSPMFRPIKTTNLAENPQKISKKLQFNFNNNSKFDDCIIKKRGNSLFTTSTHASNHTIHPDNRKIYLSGIPKNTNALLVKNIFQSYIGEVDDVNIIEQNTLGPFRYGFVTLKRAKDMELCLKLEYISIKGHRIHMKKFKRKKKRALPKREKMVFDDDL